MEDYGNEVKKGKPKWMLWAIIGIAVIVAVVVMVTQLGGNESSASGLTLDDLAAQINAMSTTVTPIVAWKATAIEDIANLKTKVNVLTTPKDWTADFAAIREDITELQSEWVDVNQTIQDAIESVNVTMPRYAMVSGMEEKYSGIYIDVSVYGAGDYPVLVSLYGSKLQNDTVSVKPSTGCVKVGEYFFYDLEGNATRRDFVMRPTVEWKSTNLIQMKAVGNATLSYAFAVVGDSWAEAEEEW